MITRSSLFALLPLLVLVSAHALASTPSDAEISEAISEKIRERHPTADCAWWRARGARTPRVIESLLVNPESKLGRLRLIEGLGCFSDSASLSKVHEIAEGASESVLRMTAVRAAARSGDSGAPEWLKGFLTHEDPRTRVAAAEALMLTGDSRAAGWIREQSEVEKEGWIARKLSQVSAGAKGSGRVEGIVISKSGQSPRASTTPGGAEVAAQERLEKRWSGTWSGYRILQDQPGKAPSSAAVVVGVEFKEHQPRVRLWFPTDMKDLPKVQAGTSLEVSGLHLTEGRWTGSVVESGGLQITPGSGKTQAPSRSFQIEGELRGSDAKPRELWVHVTEVTPGAVAQPWVLIR